ncbi:hypothetical protein BJ684DRAFT_17763 [Piptocephalis cylindrospora]|uniref:SET domain-containing protein n=1 Tax=Piptocephalis cylindrospora TaxID=1907219 RepID=A0A4P9XYY5_9FUNG|nr:hypothetical protein BJ684DRAFT_17763 [Piptocephalis cylindrospora]|eukprot:RKP11666.1 hypothetical protein BJ684DRAFT_17763 [Piptocephalis cylindrospora]
MGLIKEYLHRLYPYQLLRLLLSSRTPQKSKNSSPITPCPAHLDSTLLALLSHLTKQAQPRGSCSISTLLGFNLVVRTSRIPQAGRGVFLNGHVEQGSLVAFYPGLILDPWEPKLLPSLGNRYALRMTDGTVIDGKATGISGWNYRSIVRRDRIGPYALADTTWMDLARHDPSKDIGDSSTNVLRNPLAVGQLVNNATSPNEANVTYYEYSLHPSVPLASRHLLPNIRSSGVKEGDFSKGQLTIRSPRTGLPLVLLIATRDIRDEELYSTYMEPITSSSP